MTSHHQHQQHQHQHNSSREMLYFLAGALLPSIAFLLHHYIMSKNHYDKSISNERDYLQHSKDDFKNSKKHNHEKEEENDNDDHGECDDDDDDDDDDYDDDSAFEISDVAMDVSKSWGIQDAPYKMVLCVNTSLSMGKGKIAAQCCHAAVGCYKRAKIACPNGLAAWERTGCAKIAVKCPSEDEMMNEILIKAMQAGIPAYFVEDAGRTQIAAGSRTVLGLGPAPVYAFEGITSHLKLM